MKENKYAMLYNTGKIIESTDGFNWTITQNAIITDIEEKQTYFKMPREAAEIIAMILEEY